VASELLAHAAFEVQQFAATTLHQKVCLIYDFDEIYEFLIDQIGSS